MAKHDPNDLPPPYYSVVAHPPLKPYDEEVYGGGQTSPIQVQLQYIPQYPPPVNTPYDTKPVACTKRKSNARCLGGLAGIVLLFILLALAIWLGVRYGSRLLTNDGGNNGNGNNNGNYGGNNNGNHGGHHGGDDDDDGKDVEKHPKILNLDTCSKTAVQCNGIKDCQLGTDETDCVRFGGDGTLQIRTFQDDRFLPVCYQGWDKTYSDKTCAQLGFRKSYNTKALNSSLLKFSGLTLSNGSSLLIQGLVNISSSCPGQTTVSLQCLDCGRQQSPSRIIGGSVSKLGRWPWQVSLYYRGLHTCGGVIIAPDIVVTAAHCFPKSNPATLNAGNWRVYVGFVSQAKLPAPYLVDKILVHESYNNRTNDQDIALLRLTAPVIFNNLVQPVCLPAFDKTFPYVTSCWISGFGTTKEGTAMNSRDLLEVSVDLIDVRVCNSSRVYGGNVSKNMLCAGDLNGGRDTCQGDSGGPLMCQASDNLWYLAGITSWGSGCGRINQPGVYANITSLLPWIYSKMQEERL